MERRSQHCDQAIGNSDFARLCSDVDHLVSGRRCDQLAGTPELHRIVPEREFEYSDLDYEIGCRLDPRSSNRAFQVQIKCTVFVYRIPSQGKE